MKYDKKDEENYWMFNYATQEMCLQSDEEDGPMYRLPLEIYRKLYPYQVKGIEWMWELFCDEMGGILADDMGLGKTVQTCAFLRGIMGKCRIRRVLLVAPVSTMESWKTHIKIWAKKRTREFRGHESSKMKAFEKISCKGGVLLTSYETLRSSINMLKLCKWDYCFLDEGHKCKNPHSQQSQAIRQLRIRRCHRIMLTGTYMQNTMQELWALVDWCTQGRILGTYKEFRNTFASTIGRANYADASEQ
eukprot:UN02086